jgi:hypothetical protein
LHGEAKAGATAKGISKVLISLSHFEVRWSCIYFVIDADCLCRLLPLHLPKHRDLHSSLCTLRRYFLSNSHRYTIDTLYRELEGVSYFI